MRFALHNHKQTNSVVCTEAWVDCAANDSSQVRIGDIARVWDATIPLRVTNMPKINDRLLLS